MNEPEAPTKESPEAGEDRSHLRVSIPFPLWELIVKYLAQRPWNEVQQAMPVIQQGLPECKCQKEPKKNAALAPFAASRADRRRKGRAKEKS